MPLPNLRRAKLPHPRSLVDVTGLSLPRDKYGHLPVDFVEINLDHDLLEGLHLTLKLARASEHEIVRQIYHAMCVFWRRFDNLMTLGTLDSRTEARAMLQFPEPWEIRLGYTTAGSRGNGFSDGALSREIFAVLDQVPTLRRLLRTEPDALCSVPNVGLDRISDVIGTIAKLELIAFTQQQAGYWNFIPTCMADQPVENCWVPAVNRLRTITANLPRDDHGRIIVLVPREICRSGPPFSAAQFFRELPRLPGDGAITISKEAMLATAIARPEDFAGVVKDRLRDPTRFRAKKGYRPPRPRP
jgi:hypothetical protein